MDDKDNVCVFKSKEDFEAYCRAVDAANDAVVESAVKREAEKNAAKKDK